jgi:hypothetical protein
MTKRRTKPRSSKTRTATRPRSFDKLRTPSGNGRALVISDLVKAGAGVTKDRSGSYRPS